MFYGYNILYCTSQADKPAAECKLCLPKEKNSTWLKLKFVLKIAKNSLWDVGVYVSCKSGDSFLHVHYHLFKRTNIYYNAVYF